MSQPETSNFIYLDSAGSASNATFCSEQNLALEDNFANPNAIHEAGREAFAVMESARENFAKMIGAKRPSEIVWTSGATEANNIAILGIARALNLDNTKVSDKTSADNKRAKRDKIIVFEIEHESSLLSAKHLNVEGFKVELLPADKNGFASASALEKICDAKTALVIVQHANTEIGSIQNIADLSKIAHENGALFHCDCVGTFGKIPVDVGALGVDSASFSGHKIGAPKGIGALYLKANTPCQSIFFGGGQEHGLRPGTQSLALISAFADAAQTSQKNMDATQKLYSTLREFICDEVAKLSGVRMTVDTSQNPQNYLNNIISLLFANFDSKNLILEYGKRGIVVSGGPACSSENEEPSHVLQAIGVGKKEIDGVIRVSFCAQTTIDDVKAFIQATKEILHEN